MYSLHWRQVQAAGHLWRRVDLKRIWLALIFALVSLVPLPVLASDISGAKFYGVISIGNNSTSAASNVSVAVSINTTALTDGVYASSNMTNIVIRNTAGADLPFMPGLGGNPWIIYNASIGALSYLSNIMYVPATGGKIRYFPGSTGMTVSYNATLEPSSNFTVELDGYVDTAPFTSNGTAHADTEGTPASYAFDGNPATYWESTGAMPHWLQTDLGNGILRSCLQYKIQAPAANANRTPKDFTFQGSTDNTSWTVLDTRAGQTFSVGEIKTYALSGASSVTPYRYYSLNITASDIPNVADVAELTLTTTKILVAKGPDFQLYVGSSGNVTATVSANTSSNVSISTAVSSGEKIIVTDLNSGNLTLLVNSSLVSTPILNAPLWSSNLSGSTFTTIDSNHFTGTVTGATWTPVGRDSSGVNQNITFPSSSNILSGTNDFTLSIWTKPGTSSTGIMGFNWKSQPTNNNNYLFYKSGTTCTSILYDSGDNPLQVVADVAGVVEEGVWQQFALTKIGSNYTLYKNGSPVGGATGSTLRNLGVPSTNYYIGTDTLSGADYKGVTGEVIIYNRGLSAAEVLTNFNASKWVGSTSDDVPSSSNGWVIATNAALPYMNTYKEWVGGNLKANINWEYGPYFYDDSGNGNTATPSFRTTSSDASISASMTAFLPVTEARAPTYTIGIPSDWYATPTVTSNFTSNVTATTGGNPPGVDLIVSIANAGNTPVQLPLVLIPSIIILMSSLLLSWLLRQFGSGSLIVKIGWLTFAMGVCYAIRVATAAYISIYDLWMVVMFLIPAMAIGMASQQRNW